MGSTVGVVGVGRLELVSQSPLGGGEHHNTTKVPWRRRGREGEDCGSWAYNWCCSKGGWGIYNRCRGGGLSQHWKDAVRDAFYCQRLPLRERRPTSGNSMLTTMGGSIEVAWGGEEWVES